MHNHYLMQQLVMSLPKVIIMPTDFTTMHPDYIEAMMCAWLASQTLHHQALDLSAITGGKRTILGCVYPV